MSSGTGLAYDATESLWLPGFFLGLTVGCQGNFTGKSCRTVPQYTTTIQLKLLTNPTWIVQSLCPRCILSFIAPTLEQL